VRCGDDTPRQQGRVTIDPLAHIDWIGTIILPLGLLFLGAASGHVMLFGWGKPVLVNLNNFRQRRRDDILVSAAGPAMNFVLAILMLAGMKIGSLAGIKLFESDSFLPLIELTLFLCFFNLLPIPPLDGAHVLRNLIGISDEVYGQLSRYSFLFFMLIMRSPAVSQAITLVSGNTLIALAGLFGWHVVRV
jgi:Zn-dependent protease